ncbi:hypothetical protein BDW75DRAFT_133119 [Aspergillus navahoensis]
MINDDKSVLLVVHQPAVLPLRPLTTSPAVRSCHQQPSLSCLAPFSFISICFRLGLFRSNLALFFCLTRAFFLSSRYTNSDVYSHQEPISELLQVPLGLSSDLPLVWLLGKTILIELSSPFVSYSGLCSGLAKVIVTVFVTAYICSTSPLTDSS